VVGFEAAFGIGPDVLEAVDRHLAFDQRLVMVDAFVVKAVD
jgi:hypothetical protein